MNVEEFIKVANNIRKDAKGQWYWVSGTVNGKEVNIKAYKTWMQVFDVDGVRQWSTPDCSVKQFNDELREGLE